MTGRPAKPEITLRDYFAATCNVSIPEDIPTEDWGDIDKMLSHETAWRYRWADAMLKASVKR